MDELPPRGRPSVQSLSPKIAVLIFGPENTEPENTEPENTATESLLTHQKEVSGKSAKLFARARR
jgi:hypothetical protein